MQLYYHQETGGIKMTTYYTTTHLKLTVSEDLYTVGFSNYAITKLGNIMFLNLPEEGDEVQSGDAVGDVESIKTVTDIICPISGEVVEVNEEVADHPEKITLKPEEAWLFKIKTEDEPNDVMTEEEYLEYVKGL
jgi:glycine cleavage system H protein